MPSRDKWDLIVKGGSAVAAIGTLMVSAVVYLAQRSDSIRDFQRETQRPFLEAQFELYGEAVAIASRLARAAGRDHQWKKDDLDRFWELYWGSLAMVEDAHVEGAMVIFGRSLKDNIDRRSTDCAAKINNASLALAHAARESLEEHWGVTLIKDDALEARDANIQAQLAEICSKNRRTVK